MKEELITKEPSAPKFEESDIYEKKHSNLTLWSYSVFNVGLHTVEAVIAARLILFYQVAVFAPLGAAAIWIITFGNIFYTIWNAINDPIIGHFSDRNFKFTKRWGKRFPWIVFTSIPFFISILLIFSPPDVSIANGSVTFIWFVVNLVIFDALFTAIYVNFQGLFPNKYRQLDERRKLSTIAIVFFTVGWMVGFILNPLFITDPTNKAQYFPMALTSASIFVISLLLAIKGLKEEKQLIDTYYHHETEQSSFFREFGKNLKMAFSERSFLILVVLNVFIGLFNYVFVLGISYFALYIIQNPGLEILIWIIYVLSGAAVIPLAYILVKNSKHLKIAKIFLFLIGVVLIPMIFGNILVTLVFIGVIGMTISIFNVAIVIVNSDFYDHVAVKHKKRVEGVYTGILTFFMRLSGLIALPIIATIQSLTNFDPSLGLGQPPSALLGILLQISIIPAIAIFIAAFALWKGWHLTPKKMKQIRSQLKEMGI